VRRNNYWNLRQRRYTFVPVPDFPEEEKKKNLAKFVKKHPRAMEMLEEIKERIPWQRQFVGSLLVQVEQKGELSPKQRSLITSLYADCCIKSDADIREQVECRKLCLRLLETELGRMRDFVQSVANFTYNRPFSPLQMRSIRNMAERKRKDLEHIPDFNEKNFDGWNFARWSEGDNVDKVEE